MRHKFQWNFNQNTKLFSKENATENVVCAMFAILLRVLTCRLSETVMRMRMTFIANMGYSNRGRRPALSMTGTCRGETWWRHHMETHVTDPLCGESTGHRWSRVSKRPRQHLFIMRYKDELEIPSHIMNTTVRRIHHCIPVFIKFLNTMKPTSSDVRSV